MKLEGLNRETIKLGIAVIGAGLIGGLCWKYRKKIMKSLTTNVYVEYDLPTYTWVKGHWRFNRNGRATYVKPHYRISWKRDY